ncbi:hypothetical protein HCN51_46475 [Nonomuraea sp. FMUSA5-5]|uniref:WXG100 family type VII secretion target n=1 Tax=Nonomuraea composti TaxID=2720023 RepID=A0ABX1BGB8_9ACTN|nr:hypothetical protein [Nonomuraea sp. FMUSA5-5]NJP96795.1 hypothetical protein [Nonomuraea sp. FMUSA5-5]
MTIPSQGQLLRQAAEKEQLATTLIRYAGQLAEVYAGALTRPQGVDAFWKGPAAGRFSSQTVQLAREIDLLRENCISTADHLRKQAQAASAEAAQMPA